MYCSNCGKEISDNAVICIHCGCATGNNYNLKKANNNSNTNAFENNSNQKDWIVAIVLAWFLGGFGAHRFYLGHTALGIAQLFTLGGCGIWALIDFILLCFNKIKDGEGNELKSYSSNAGTIVFAIFIFLTVIWLMFFLISICVSE